MRSIQERLQNALASAQARARTASALPSPPPSSVEQLKHNQSKRSIASSPVPSSKSAGSPLLRPVSVETKRSESIEDKPRLPKKSKSRTVVGHLGTVRKVEVPSSASESEGD